MVLALTILWASWVSKSLLITDNGNLECLLLQGERFCAIMLAMAFLRPPEVICIYVRKRRIMRNGQMVDGWQAGFSKGRGGVTSESREEVITCQTNLARKNMPDCIVKIISESTHPSTKGSRCWITKDALNEWKAKAKAFDRLISWIELLEHGGVAGRFIAPREIREVLEGKNA